MPRFNENIRKGSYLPLAILETIYSCPLLRLVPSRSLKAKCSLSLNSCQHSHSHVRLPTFFTACLLLLCLLSTDEFVSGLDSSLPSSLIVPQFPHQASQFHQESNTMHMGKHSAWFHPICLPTRFQESVQDKKPRAVSTETMTFISKQVPGHTTSDQELSFYYSSLRKS